MAKLHDVMSYIISKYPLKHELSNARLTKLVYLSDWKHCLSNNSQITDISWYFNNYGPFVWDVKDAAKGSPDVFLIKEDETMFGSEKTIISLQSNFRIKDANLTADEVKAIDHIIGITKNLYWDDFIRLVYSTYPISKSERYTYLDLKSLASDYKKLKVTPKDDNKDLQLK